MNEAMKKFMKESKELFDYALINYEAEDRSYTASGHYDWDSFVPCLPVIKPKTLKEIKDAPRKNKKNR